MIEGQSQVATKLNLILLKPTHLSVGRSTKGKHLEKGNHAALYSYLKHSMLLGLKPGFAYQLKDPELVTEPFHASASSVLRQSKADYEDESIR